MLKTVSIHGFKSIERQTIELAPLNILIGANGSGKSNLLQALFFFRAAIPETLRTLVQKLGGADRLLHHGKKITGACYLACRGDRFFYEKTLVPTAGDGLTISEERISASAMGEGATPFDIKIARPGDHLHGAIAYYLDKAVAAGKRTEEEARLVLDAFTLAQQNIEGWRLYHFHDTSDTAAVKSDCNINDNRYLRENASNLAAYLYWLKQRHPVPYRQIVSTLRLAAPYFDDFILEPSRHNERMIHLEWKHKYSDAYFDADALSDGTLRFMALTTLLNQPADALPSFIVIDEPELGLHPLAIRLLAEMLDVASQYTQILVATQSVTLVDHFSLDRIIVVDHHERGSQFRRLREADYQHWLEDFSTGELWEKNVLGGRP